MNIYIVHLPNTFSYLIDLSLVFHKYGFSSITLVANGFDHNQIKELEKFAAKYSYVSILDVPTRRVLSHGEALNYAYRQSKDEYFCFADHDIFPISPLTNIIKYAAIQHDVICFGNRPENAEINYEGFAASSLTSMSGHNMATSFFSIFKKAVVDDIYQKFNIGFEQYFRKSQIPKSFSNHSDIQALKEPFLIDTCKLLSLAIDINGNSIVHLGSEFVCHLGGLCGSINRYTNNNLSIEKEIIINPLPCNDVLEQYYIDHQQRHPEVLELKRKISDYSLQVLIAYKKELSPPKLICKDPNLYSTIKNIEDNIRKVFKSE